MINMISQNGDITAYVTEYVVDTEADIFNLPTDVAPGSTCIVISSSSVYMLNGAQEWQKI